jgi:cellulose synthase/poly-beta-1,6-N-acetylglucosamine synthase-like glycosyltransferase
VTHFVEHPIRNPTEATIVICIEVAFFLYFLVTNGFYIVTAAIALVQLPRFISLHRGDPVRYAYSTLDPVSILVPAYNEADGILNTVASLLAQRYNEYEVVVVNDGSTDDTLQVLAQAYGLEAVDERLPEIFPTAAILGIYQSASVPHLRVIDKANGGKADALNAGIATARFQLIFACDGDSYYSTDALECLIEPFARDPRTVVSGGAIGVSNGCVFEDGRIVERRLSSNWIVRFQVLEYMRAFLASRLGWAPLNALYIVSGACGLYLKSAIVDAGGYRTDTIWEDLEMTIRIHRRMLARGISYRVAYTPFVVCWTKVPATLGELWAQREGWHRHVGECAAIHRGLFFAKRSASIGRLGFPYLVIGELIAPAMVLSGLIFGLTAAYLGFISYESQAILLLLVFSLGLAVCMASILLDELSFNTYTFRELGILLVASLFEFFGFRQFVTLANFIGLLAWLTGRPIRHKSAVPGLKLPTYDPRVP